MAKQYYLSWMFFSMSSLALADLPFLSPSDRITTCAATTCLAGFECRIVVKNSYQIGPKCLKPSLIPGQGSPERCGTSGHPVLLVKHVGKKIEYVVFKTIVICPTLDLVFVKGICCAETEKVGSCPPVPLSPAESSGRAVRCDFRCRGDNECKGSYKCCKNSSGGTTCVKPVSGFTCETVVCDPGYVCILQNIQCVAPPCLPIPVCVPPGTHPGQCPTPRLDSVSSCRFLCDNDTQCTVREKCCPTSCGGTICTPSLPYISNCDTVICPTGKTCREVIHKKGDISPECLENPPKTPQGDHCVIGLPLLQAYIKEITVVRCYKDGNRVSCPFGYNCKLDSNNTWSLCCRNKETSCIPPCAPRERCQTQVIHCLVPPCPPAPRCETKDICQLPKEVGPCGGFNPSYYYNTKTNRCEFFYYGGCDGNENNFSSLYTCNSTCPKDFCQLPKDVGQCGGIYPSYYYDAQNKTCKFFNYEGCGGNENRFSSKDVCYKACSPAK